MTPRSRRRMQLTLLLAVFAVPALLAVLLGALGWQPGTRSHGQPILPQRNLQGVTIEMANGKSWPWRDNEPRMSLLVLPGPDCAGRCMHTLALMRNARITLNKNMGRLRLLYVGAPLTEKSAEPLLQGWAAGRDVDGSLEIYRATAPDTVSALLVESNGTALTLYPAGFDVNGLRKDLQKVIR